VGEITTRPRSVNQEVGHKVHQTVAGGRVYSTKPSHPTASSQLILMGKQRFSSFLPTSWAEFCNSETPETTDPYCALAEDGDDLVRTGESSVLAGVSRRHSTYPGPAVKIISYAYACGCPSLGCVFVILPHANTAMIVYSSLSCP